MKWLGWVIVFLTLIILVPMILLVHGSGSYFIALYGGLLAYWNFRETWDKRKEALVNLLVVGIPATIIFTIGTIILRNFAKEMLVPVEESPIEIMVFIPPNIYPALIIGALFVGVPALLAFLEGLTPPDSEGLRRNPFFVLMLVMLTFGAYIVYWFWLIKKGLRKGGIETSTLWWFLLPIIGWIIVYVSFSQGLEKKTRTGFWAWFLIFFFVSGLDVVINQAIINHSLQKTQG